MLGQDSTKRNVYDLGYRPREWQKIAQDSLIGKKYGVFICSRQIGKTVSAISILCNRALRGPAQSACCYVAPANVQARRIAWPGIKQRLKPLGDKVKFYESNMVAVLPGDRKIYVLGAESGDTIRGASFHTCIIDEYDNISDDFFNEVLLPTTSAWGDQSFVLFIGTLGGGDSSLWRLFMDNRNDDEWACIRVPASDSHCFTDEWLADRRKMMGESAFLREYEADPKAPVENAVLGREMEVVASEGRIEQLPYRHGKEVHTSWDLGIRDFTTVWGWQQTGRYIELLFYREFAGIGMIDVMARIQDEFPHYRWGEAALPHDAKNRDKVSAVSVADAFYEHWKGTVDVQQSAPNPIATLQSCRVNMPRCKFDEIECELGILRLKSAKYVKDPKTGTILDRILHDDNSHCLDAFRLGMYRIESLHPASSPDEYAPWHSDDNALSLPSRYFE